MDVEEGYGDEGKALPNVLSQPRPGVLVAEQRRRRPGSNSAGSQKETDIAVCSQGVWSCPSPVYKDWAVAPDLLSCTRLSVSLTKRITPTRSFRGLVLSTHYGVLLLCLTTFRRMSGVLWICFWKQQRCMENNIKNLPLKPWDCFLCLI